jgi:hypothetical protein
LIPNSCLRLVKRASTHRPQNNRSRSVGRDANISHWGCPFDEGRDKSGQTEGREIFADALTRFAEQNCNPRLTPIIGRMTAPLRVAVWGRDGVGRATVAAALAAAGLVVNDQAADIHVVVIAETLKPEDKAMIAAVDGPVLTVLNKADLTGFSSGGPLALAHRRAADCRALTGTPTVPMVAALAVAELDGDLISALRTLVADPADLSSTDAFLGSGHSVPQDIRRRLLDTLDRFGIAHAVLALSEGAADAEVTALLRRASLVDRVVEHLDAIAAPIRYRRMKSAITELRVLATQLGDERLTELLSADETVLAVMNAAIDVVEAQGLTVDAGDDHLRRAAHWRRYSRGPVDGLHRSCGADIARGSLRLLGRIR